MFDKVGWKLGFHKRKMETRLNYQTLVPLYVRNNGIFSEISLRQDPTASSLFVSLLPVRKQQIKGEKKTVVTADVMNTQLVCNTLIKESKNQGFLPVLSQI